jgi:hypothetical protein
VAVLDGSGLQQPIAGAVRVAPLAGEALRVDVGEATALAVVLVGFQKAAGAVGDAGEATCGIMA